MNHFEGFSKIWDTTHAHAGGKGWGDGCFFALITETHLRCGVTLHCARYMDVFDTIYPNDHADGPICLQRRTFHDCANGIWICSAGAMNGVSKILGRLLVFVCSADVFENSSRGWNPVTVFFHSESVSLLQLHKPGFLPGRLFQLACGGFALSSHRGWNRRLLLGSLAFIAGIVYPTPSMIHAIA